MSIGGNNIRKGLNLLIDSLKFVKNDFQLVIVGDQYPTNIPKQLNYKFIDSPKTSIQEDLFITPQIY